MTLLELRRRIVGPVHARSFTNEAADGAIWAAGNRLASEGQIIRETLEVPIVLADDEIDITAISADFEDGQMTAAPWLGDEHRLVWKVDQDVLSDFRNRYPDASGPPEMITFPSRDRMLMFPEADAAYTLHLPRWVPFTQWTIGTMGTWSETRQYKFGDVVGWESSSSSASSSGSSSGENAYASRAIRPSLNQSPDNLTYWEPWPALLGTPDPGDMTFNLPDHELSELIWWGQRAYLLVGWPGHPDGTAAMAEFDRHIQRRKGAVTTTGTMYCGRRHDKLFNTTYLRQLAGRRR